MSIVKQYNPEDPVQVTAEAKAHFLKRVKVDPDCAGVRVTVKESGCSGYQYAIDYVKAVDANDLRVALDANNQLYVDANALPILKGTVIHLVKEGLNESVQFQNPNVKSRCGCGESFSIEAS